MTTTWRSQPQLLDDRHKQSNPEFFNGLLGVIAVSITPHPDLGVLSFQHGPFTVAFVGPGDPSDPLPQTGTPLPDYLIVAHPALAKKGRTVEFKLPWDLQKAFARDCQGNDLEPNPGAELYTLDQYHDPVGLEDAGDWLAAFAPVGRTGFVVIVQQKND